MQLPHEENSIQNIAGIPMSGITQQGCHGILYAVSFCGGFFVFRQL
jgi:hypothetical protein